MLDFFRRLRSEGKVVFVCLHRNEPYHVELMQEICERFVFVNRGRLTYGPSLAALTGHAPFREYTQLARRCQALGRVKVSMP